MCFIKSHAGNIFLADNGNGRALGIGIGVGFGVGFCVGGVCVGVGIPMLNQIIKKIAISEIVMYYIQNYVPYT